MSQLFGVRWVGAISSICWLLMAAWPCLAQTAEPVANRFASLLEANIRSRLIAQVFVSDADIASQQAVTVALTDILNQIRQTKIIPSDEVVNPEHPDRISARYVFSGNKIYLFRKIILVPDDLVALLGTHEFLGLLGYSDDAYGLTMALWAYPILFHEKKENLPERDELLREIDDEVYEDIVNGTLQRQLRLASGGNMVGGGGDVLGVALKQALLKRCFARHRDAELIRRVLQAGVVIVRDAGKGSWSTALAPSYWIANEPCQIRASGEYVRRALALDENAFVDPLLRDLKNCRMQKLKL